MSLEQRRKREDNRENIFCDDSMLAALMYVKSQGIEETDKAKFQDLLNLVSIDSVDEDSSDGESNNQVSFVDSRPEHKNSKISDE